MAKILLIETSTALCSAALEIDGKVVSSRRSDSYTMPDGSQAPERSHAALTAVFCNEVLHEASMTASQLDAVCISEGPGSYTGLRVGLSTAKGLCFGAGVKLLSVSSLDVLAQMAFRLAPAPFSAIVPMIDARRMEVYTATYDEGGNRISPVEAKVVESGDFADIAQETVFIGDGAVKCREAIGAGMFVDVCPEASSMALIAEEEFASGNFRDVAYFEPFYLKEFTVTTSKKKLF